MPTPPRAGAKFYTSQSRSRRRSPRNSAEGSGFRICDVVDLTEDHGSAHRAGDEEARPVPLGSAIVLQGD